MKPALAALLVALASWQIPPQPTWHLAEMAGQGEYFVLQQHTWPDERTCEHEARARDYQEASWRWICVQAP
jgi:hypothetical protein